MVRSLSIFAATIFALISLTAVNAHSNPAMCLKTCMETYGADKKQACALQCGYGKDNLGAGQTRDCGAIYKQCMRSCTNDTTCKSACRKQRTSCY